MFADWLAKHHRILHKVANSFAVGQDRDDLMQEMLVSLWRAIPSFRGEASASTFAYRVVHHCALTWIRGETRRLRKHSAAARDLLAANAEDASSDSRLELLYECIRELPAIDRSVITMALDGLSHAQIGDIIGSRENTISVRIHRIRKQLASAIQKKST